MRCACIYKVTQSIFTGGMVQASSPRRDYPSRRGAQSSVRSKRSRAEQQVSKTRTHVIDVIAGCKNADTVMMRCNRKLQDILIRSVDFVKLSCSASRILWYIAPCAVELCLAAKGGGSGNRHELHALLHIFDEPDDFIVVLEAEPVVESLRVPDGELHWKLHGDLSA